MKTCLLVLGGEIKDYLLFAQRLAEADLVLAADSGARHLRCVGVLPQVIYGDLDSLSQEEIIEFKEKGCRFVTHQAEKDDTDGALVLREALRRGYMDIRIWGAMGGRPDHAYANLMLLQLMYQKGYREVYGCRAAYGCAADVVPGCAADVVLGCAADVEPGRAAGAAPGSAICALPNVSIEDGGIRISLAKRRQWIEGKAGDVLSLFALTPEVTGFKQTGLKYQPEGGLFVSSFPLGVSNVFMQDRVWMDWDRGLLLCMHIEV